MKIRFNGATRTVTGSCHLLEINGKNVLLDFGLFQGPRAASREINEQLPVDPRHLDAVILSHGHLDHCGRLPMLFRGGYSGPVFCTAATAAVARIVLSDSAEIQEEDAGYLNRRTRVDGPPVVALYTRADVPAVLRSFKHVAYATPFDVAGITFTLYDAGHILGSSYITAQWKENGTTKRLLFTADIGRYDTPIINDPATLPGPFDVVITESTYGNKTHTPIADAESQLLDAIRDAQDRGGRVIIPAFAVGRTQTLLWYVENFILSGKIKPLPVFVDSPMGTEVSKVYCQHTEGIDDPTRDAMCSLGLGKIKYTQSVNDSKAINLVNGPAVIIASSPTMEFGRVLHHVKHSIENKRDMLVVVGYTPGNTLGRRLQDGHKRVRILDRYYHVEMEVRPIAGLSAHADKNELLRFLEPTLKPDTQFYVVHGEPESADAFAEHLLAAGVGGATVPAMETMAAE